ncbi:MAG: tripartite tricarboxylate transporter TctB family protein [Rhodospirillales bacterium]|nr:tripartite tricarboxylate transporter TctB family protein [Rhodospirillales bacterium]
MIRNARDVLAGLLFMAFGAVALVMAQSYAIGTAARMGPGYFPRLLGFLLLGLGALQLVLGLRSRVAAPLDLHWRPLAILLLSVSLFIVLTPLAGLVASGLVLVLVSSIASREFRWKEALIAGLVLGAAAAALFVRGLGVPLPVWPDFGG